MKVPKGTTDWVEKMRSKTFSRCTRRRQMRRRRLLRSGSQDGMKKDRDPRLSCRSAIGADRLGSLDPRDCFVDCVSRRT